MPFQDLEDDIDVMMGKAKQKTVPKKQAAKAKPRSKASKPTIVKSTTKQGTPSKLVEHAKKSPPKYGAALPMIYNGCKVYESKDRFRVVPFPGESKYDKAFQFKTPKAKRAQWDSLIEYCKKPSIPSTSTNAIE